MFNHCEFVKELMNYLAFMFSGKGIISQTFDVCKAFYRTDKEDQSLMDYYLNFTKVYEELNTLLPSCTDPSALAKELEQKAVMVFLVRLRASYDMTQTQVLSQP